MAVDYTIDFNQAPEKVFRYLDEPSLIKQWMPELVSIETLTEGANRVGAKSKHIYNENGQTIEMVEEMLIYEPNRRIKIRGEAKGFELLLDYRLEAIPQGSRLHYHETMTMQNWFMRLLSPIIASSQKAKIKVYMERLKALVEA
jgi:uncharacterized protein YndB with AHSA1/START domain